MSLIVQVGLMTAQLIGALRRSCSVYWLLSISPSCISGTVWDIAVHASFNVAVWDVAMMVPLCLKPVFTRAQGAGYIQQRGSRFWIEKDNVRMHWPLS